MDVKQELWFDFNFFYVTILMLQTKNKNQLWFDFNFLYATIFAAHVDVVLVLYRMKHMRIKLAKHRAKVLKSVEVNPDSIN